MLELIVSGVGKLPRPVSTSGAHFQMVLLPDRSLSGVNSGESLRFFSGFAFGVCTVHSEYFSGLIIARNKLTSSFVIGK
jgi:hypothetical protein